MIPSQGTVSISNVLLTFRWTLFPQHIRNAFIRTFDPENGIPSKRVFIFFPTPASNFPNGGIWT